jgi:large subunit ribosomal protein L4
VINDLGIDSASTKAMSGLLKSLGLERSALIVTAQADEHVKLSTRNIEKVKTLPAAYLNVVDMLNAQAMVMTIDAVRGAEAMWGGERAKKRVAAGAEAE